MNKILWTIVLLLSIPCISFAGPKWEIGEDGWMSLSFLGQVHYSFLDDAEDEKDFYLRRGRIIIAGQMTDGIRFFAETDNANQGKTGVDTKTEIQDAFGDIRLGQSNQWIKFGLILLPFSFENRSSAATLLGLDYNTEVLKLNNSFVWRDYGAELAGLLGDKIDYRVGVFDGYKAYDRADLRVTGHVAFSPVGAADSNWFYTQNKLGKENYLSLGAGYDWQDRANVNDDGVEKDSDAWVADAVSGFNLGADVGLTLNAAYYDWDSISFEGNTMFVETGLLFLDKIQPTFKYSLQDPDDGDNLSDYTVGLHYFLLKHNLRTGVEYRTGDSSDWFLAGVQFYL